MTPLTFYFNLDHKYMFIEVVSYRKIYISMSIITCSLDSTCKFIDLQKYLQKRRIVKQIKKVNGVAYYSRTTLFTIRSRRDRSSYHVRNGQKNMVHGRAGVGSTSSPGSHAFARENDGRWGVPRTTSDPSVVYLLRM
jgi:hypothetical protein